MLIPAWISPCSFVARFQQWFLIVCFLELKESDWSRVIHLTSCWKQEWKSEFCGLAWCLNHYTKWYYTNSNMRQLECLTVWMASSSWTMHNWHIRLTSWPNLLPVFQEELWVQNKSQMEHKSWMRNFNLIEDRQWNNSRTSRTNKHSHWILSAQIQNLHLPIISAHG